MYLMCKMLICCRTHCSLVVGATMVEVSRARWDRLIEMSFSHVQKKWQTATATATANVCVWGWKWFLKFVMPLCGESFRNDKQLLPNIRHLIQEHESKLLFLNTFHIFPYFAILMWLMSVHFSRRTVCTCSDSDLGWKIFHGTFRDGLWGWRNAWGLAAWSSAEGARAGEQFGHLQQNYTFWQLLWQETITSRCFKP